MKKISIVLVLFIFLSQAPLNALHVGDGATHVFDASNPINDSVLADFFVANLPGTHLDILDDAFIDGDVQLHNFSTADMTGGHITGVFDTFDNSSANIHGGFIFRQIQVAHDSQLNIWGGSIGAAHGAHFNFNITTRNNGRIDIYGTDFSINGQNLSDGEDLLSHSVFNFPNNSFTGQLEGTLADGSSFDNEYFIFNLDNYAGTANIYVHIIPEPVTSSLLILGGISVLRRRK